MRRVMFLMIVLMLLVAALWGVVTAAPEMGSATLSPEEAQVNLWMSTDPQGTPMVSFPSGIQVLYAVMEYSNLSSQSVRVTVTDDGNVVLLDHEETYTGSARTAFELTGSGMLDAYQDDIAAHGQNMTMKINEAVQYVQPGATVTETLSITPTVQAAVTEAGSMQSGLQRVLERFPQSPETQALLQQAISALDDVITAGEEATEAGRTLEEMRARINTMSTRGAEAVDYANQARVEPPAGLAVPETPACRSNVSNLYIGSQLAATVEWLVGDPGQPDDIEVVASPSSIYATSVVVPDVPVTHTATIRATVTDEQCRPVPGVSVHFITSDPSLGTVAPDTATTSALSSQKPGVATTTLTAGSEVGEGMVVITATAESAVGTEQVTLVGPTAALGVRVTRKHMEAAGEANLVVVDARDAHNWPVVDGTQVTFSIDPADFGAWSQETVRTQDGLASSYFNPGSVRGSAEITASVDSVQSEPVQVWIVGPADIITVTAEPDVIRTTLPSAFSQITAYVQDDEGHPAADGTMIRFEIDDSSLGSFEDGDPRCDYCSVSAALQNGVATAKLFATGEVGEAEITICVRERNRDRCQVGGPYEFTTVSFVGEPPGLLFLPYLVKRGQ